MLKRFFAVLLFLLILLPSGVQAQQNLRFTALEIDLWPEYDQPAMLVIYRAQLASDVALTDGVEVTVRIPAAVGEPNAVATQETGGGLILAPYERQVEGMWAYITFETTAPGIQLEYYDPALEKQGSERRYEFKWVEEHDVENFVLQVQNPVGASNLAVEPDQGEFETGGDGLLYYNLDLGAISAEETVTVNVSYQKQDDALSVEAFQQPEPTAPSNLPESTGQNIKNLLPWILGGAGVLLIAAGAGWFWKTNQGGSTSPRSSKRRASSRPSKPKTNKIYCHQCGKSAAPGDRFCRACGTRLKS